MGKSETHPGTDTAASVIRLLAPNPGLMTGPGTNTYVVVSEGECVIIDPGPSSDRHRSAIRQTLRGLQPRAVLVTHTHSDHVPLAGPIADEFGIRSYGYAPGSGFDPDRRLRHGDRVVFGGTALEALHTPGHTPDHLCYRMDDTVFTGDHIIGGSTVLVEDMDRYLRSLHLLRKIKPAKLLPGHGEEIADPVATIDRYIHHRMAREAQIIEAVRTGAGTVEAVVNSVYSDVDPRLHPAATASVVAHLRKLATENRLRFADTDLSGDPDSSVAWNLGVEPGNGA